MWWATVAALVAWGGEARADIRRLPGTVAPTFQEVFLKLDPAQPGFVGSVRIDLDIKQPVTSFRLHATTARITSVILRDSSGLVPTTADSADADEQVTITCARPLIPGPAVLGLQFTNVFNTQAIGLYHAEAAGDWYALTQMEPDDCRLAFPCFDEPAFKIPWQFTLEIPESLSAVTNAPEESRSVHEGWERLVFKKTPPMSSYLVAIAVGPLEFVEIPGVSIPVRIVTARGQSGHVSLASELVPPVVAALEAWFGMPVPYEKLDLVAAPEFWPGAMENPGAIFFADRHLIQDAATAGKAQRRNLTSLLAHEVAHLWFGDYVTMTWWNDLWLNESFAVWLGDRITDQIHPEFQSPITELTGTQSFMGTDARVASPAIRQPVVNSHDLLGNVGLVYAKGKRILGMFEGWMGPEAFRRGVNQYLADHAFGNAEAKDLWNALSQSSGLPVADALPSFLEKPGYPIVRVRAIPGGRLELTQKRYRPGGEPTSTDLWSIPLGYAAGWSDSTVRSTILFQGRELLYQLNPGRAPRWLYPNRGGIGYYRWFIPAEAMLTLADSSAAWLMPIERAEMSGNLTGLMEGGLLNSAVWLNLQGRLADDPSPMVTAAVIDNITGNLDLLAEPSAKASLAIWIQKNFRPMLDRIGIANRPDEMPGATFLRPKLIQLLGRSGRDETVLSESRRQFDRWLTDDTAVDPGLRPEMFRVAATDGNEPLWERARQKFLKTNRPGDRRLLLTTLGAFRDPKLARKSLDFLFDPAVRPTEFLPLLGEVANHEPGRDLAFEWLVEEYDRVAAKMDPIRFPFLARTLAGPSIVRLAALETFFGDPSHQAPGTLTELARAKSDQVVQKALRDREGPVLTQYLVKM